MDNGEATVISALIGAAATITVAILTTRRQRGSVPEHGANGARVAAPVEKAGTALAEKSSGVRSVAWGRRSVAWIGAILLYLITIFFLGNAISALVEDGTRWIYVFLVAFIVGIIFVALSIWATRRILAA
jgi:hypothetical protein